MVWGGISSGGKTDLVLIEGNLNGQRYITEILQSQVVPYAGAIGDEFILMDDSACPHRARVVDQFQEVQGVTRMEWPANSPDLNPIEHLWDQLKRAVRRRINQNTTLGALYQLLSEEWAALPPQRLSDLIDSMPDRCNQVLMKNGGYTSY